MRITKKVEQEVTIETTGATCCSLNCEYADKGYGSYWCAYFKCGLNPFHEPYRKRCQQCIDTFGDGKGEWVTLEEFLKTDPRWVVLEKKYAGEDIVVFVGNSTSVYWLNNELGSVGKCDLLGWKNELVRPFPEGKKVTISFRNRSPH